MAEACGTVTDPSHIARKLLLGTALLFSAIRGFALDPTSHITQYGHSIWRQRDGYLGGAPEVITQTADGYIWVGTDAGLFQFDGVRFVAWKPSSGEELPSSQIYSLLGARDGSLWIGTDAGLAHLVNHRLTLYQKNEGWGFDRIFEDRDGKIWFMRIRPDDKTHPLCQLLGDEVRCYGSKDGLDVVGTGPITRDTQGALWFGSSTAIVKWQPGDPIIYRPPALRSNEGNEGVSALSPATDGSLWVGTAVAGRGGGLQHLVNGRLVPIRTPNFDGETLAVTTLRGDRQNSLWVGTAQHGLYRVRGGEVDHFDSGAGLSGDWVRDIFEDREGNIWVATSQGIDMFRDLRVKSISHREGLTGDEVDSLAASPDGTVWVGADRPQMIGPRGISLFEPAKNLPGHLATSSFFDHTGRLWAGMSKKLFVYEQGHFREVTKPDGSAFGMAMGITEDPEHNIWVESGGPPGTLVLIHDFKVSKEFPAPATPVARKIAADLHGGIWLGLTTGDLARFQDGHAMTYSFGEHPKTRVRAISVASDGSVLAATAFGVLGWKNGKQQILTVQNGLPCITVNTLIFDNAKNLWLYAECGLIEIPNEQLALWWDHPESSLAFKIYDTLDGAETAPAPFNSSTKTPDGRLWFTNNTEVQVIDPAHIPENKVPPPLDISTLIADRRAYPLDSAIRLPPNTHELEIDYTALSFSAPQKVRFRYLLEGYDLGWKEAGTRRQAFFNDLAPGKYRFRVKACNNDGIWNETGASLDFSILPAYYQTSWFRAACVAGFFLLLWFIYRMRVMQLERAMATRFDERLQERTRIARDFHDTYLQTIQGSKLVADSALRQSPEPARMRAALEQLSTWLARATEEGRAALSSMRSSATQKNDLAAAFQRAIDECRINSSLEAAFSVTGKPSEMHPIVRDEVYRIGYEAIRNACVHSQASHLKVELTYADDLVLKVRDNGIGIQRTVVDEGREGHFGLQGMRERARRIMAKLTVNTSANSGTEVMLVVPGRIIYRSRVR